MPASAVKREPTCITYHIPVIWKQGHTHLSNMPASAVKREPTCITYQ